MFFSKSANINLQVYSIYKSNLKKSVINKIYLGSLCCYLEIENTNGSKTAYAFDGYLKRDDKFIYELVSEYIDQNGAFYQEKTKIAPRNTHKLGFDKLLYGYYYHIDITSLSKEEYDCIGLCSKRPMSGYNELLFFRNEIVFNLTQNNIMSNNNISYGQTNIIRAWNNALLVDEDEEIRIICKGESFCTGSSKTLRDCLCKVSSWNVSGGALKACIQNKKQTQTIPFAFIVWAAHYNLINAANFKKTIIAAYQNFRKNKMEIDHLTEDPTKNYIRDLAAMPNRVNHALQNRRSKIKHPYFFETRNDYENNRFIVTCGISNIWTRSILFNSLENEDEANSYLKCFETFKKKTQEADEISFESKAKDNDYATPFCGYEFDYMPIIKLPFDKGLVL